MKTSGGGNEFGVLELWAHTTISLLEDEGRMKKEYN